MIFERENTDEISFVDASNALNSLNGKAELHNTRIIRPKFSTVLINTYQLLWPYRLLVYQGRGEILSVEGTIQGEKITAPLATIMILQGFTLPDDVT